MCLTCEQIFIKTQVSDVGSDQKVVPLDVKCPIYHFLPYTIFYNLPFFTIYHFLPFTIFYHLPFFTIYHFLPFTIFYHIPFFTIYHFLPFKNYWKKNYLCRIICKIYLSAIFCSKTKISIFCEQTQCKLCIDNLNYIYIIIFLQADILLFI